MPALLLISIIGVAEGLLLGLTILAVAAASRGKSNAERRRRRARFYLGAFLVAVAVSIAANFNDLLPSERWPQLAARVTPVALLAFGPLFRSYVQVIIGHPTDGRGWQLLHSLPFGAVLVAVLVAKPAEAVGSALTVARILHVIVYFVLILLLRRRHVRQIEAELSYRSKVDLLWVQYVIGWVLGVFAFLAVVGTLVLVGVNSGVVQWSNEITAGAVAVFVFSVAVWGWLQPQLVRPASPRVTAGGSANVADLERGRRAIEAAMQADQLYRNSKLTVADLAIHIGMPVDAVSQAINRLIGVSFFELINRYRVGEVQAAMEDEERLRVETILGVAFDAGFSSKTAFNEAFRRHSGMTPSQYLKGARA